MPRESALRHHSEGTLSDRDYWITVLLRLALPVLEALAEQRLLSSMPFWSGGTDASAWRRRVAGMEALSRLLAGIAPWLELPDDGDQVRQRIVRLTRQALANAMDPESPDHFDYSDFSGGLQPIVEAAFLAHAIVRAPRALGRELDARTRQNLVAALKSTRARKPAFNNWLLFAAMVETALFVMGEDYDSMRVDYALRQHEQWYKGDGHYGDGPQFRADYYNSYVIHPMLIDIAVTLAPTDQGWSEQGWSNFPGRILPRAQRYAVVQERMISPEGTFPPLGRSLTYRFGAFQLLAQMALRRELPEALQPAQVRSGLSAVIRRMIDAPGTFDAAGWLQPGFCGAQPGLAEGYISTGSLYLCSTGLLPLGLPASDPFWTDPPADWTSRKVWSGTDLASDHALHDV